MNSTEEKFRAPVFILYTNEAWCENCGTISTDGACHCTEDGKKPNWQPHDRKAIEHIAKLRAHIEAVKTALTGDISGSHRDEVAQILQTMVQDGFPGPRDLDAAIDALDCVYIERARAELEKEEANG